MDFDKAVELRRRGWGYKRIADALGVGEGAVRRRFKAQYDQGNLLEISGYGGADPRTRSKSKGCQTRGGLYIPIGEPVHKDLTNEQIGDLAVRIEKLGHRTLNDYLRELMLDDIS